MSQLRQLSPRETFFIGGETDKVYQHTGGLVMLDASDKPGFNYHSFRQRLEERLSEVPQFRWKLHQVPLGLDLPYWIEDERFNFDNHIRRIALPSPGDRQSLADLVAYVYSRHLDRSRPLWETWFVEGLEDGQYALVQKLHHCLMDGEGAARLGERLVDFEPDAEPRPVDPEIREALPGRKPGRWEASVTTARHMSRMPFRVSREVSAMAVPRLRTKLFGGGQGQQPSTPLACFNADISPRRGFVFTSLPLEAVKAVKDHFEVTVNDVVLALVSGALRHYLLARQALPDESLRTSIAVSLREADDEDMSNRVTSTSVTLATAEPDPSQRLQAIALDSKRAKAAAQGGATDFMEIMQTLPPLLVNTMMHLSPPHLAPAMTASNLVVSNVRGSPWPMYMAGARKTAMYPMSIITPGTGLNVTCISYAGNIDFGITVEPELIPEPWTLIDGLEQALADYQALAGRRKRGPRTKRAGGNPQKL